MNDREGGRLFPDTGTLSADCSKTWASLRSDLNAREGDYLRIQCSDACTGNVVMGTGYYTDDSNACASLAHSQGVGSALHVQFHASSRSMRFYGTVGQQGIQSESASIDVGDFVKEVFFVSVRAALVNDAMARLYYGGGASRCSRVYASSCVNNQLFSITDVRCSAPPHVLALLCATARACADHARFVCSLSQCASSVGA